MRFPIDPLPPIGEAENPYEIREKAPVSPLQPVKPRTQPPLVFQHRRYYEQTVQPRQAGEERRSDDRRQNDRRQSNRNVLIDTRSGHDRRNERRRSDDPTTRGIDEKA